jgi:rSAM/selenodomain-associated transferase 2
MKLSIVIPTLEEATGLSTTLASLPEASEVIVSDGGSRDATRAIAERVGARVVTGARGRASQMNLGAHEAAGEVLLFLHADCALHSSSLEAMGEALSDPRVVGGSFRMQIRNAGVGLKIVAFVSNLRARFLKIPYGDQGLFVRQAVFESVGGFPEVPLMEDVALVRSLLRIGRLSIVKVPVTTSARHWERLGPTRTTLVNWSAAVLYSLGVPAERLAPLYHRLRRGGDGATSEAPLPQPD